MAVKTHHQIRVAAALAVVINLGSFSAATWAQTSDPVKLKAQVDTLATQLVSTAEAGGAPAVKVDDATLRSEIETALLGVLASSGVDPATGLAALHEALTAPRLTQVERDAIRALIQKLEKSKALDPSALGLGVNLVPPPPGGFNGGSGYLPQ